MLQAKDIAFEWYDAWILYAVLLSARPDEYAPLDAIIGSADYINHAIPTSGELDGALSRLIENGWVEQSNLSFAPSGKAESMFAKRRTGRTSVPTDLEFVRKQMGAGRFNSQCSIPKDPEVFLVKGLNDAVIESAYDAYKKRARSV